ncbi:hypothetical protein NVP1007O_15 [Vibrio phage 1.007.O._10N.261.55.F9]|nr:hypothetical protein NVP1007O_15 [Vibrio phage 1.007.O._10N.261.55.F9]
MITCKEDLINTYVKNDGGKLVSLYLEKCKEFGFVWFSGVGIEYHRPFSGAVGLNEDVRLSVSDSSEEYFIKQKCKELTLSDLKPTPTKFVKVEESIFDLKGEFERGELYSSDCEGHYTQLKCEKKLYLAAHQDSVYRQVEIDWRDEVNSYFLKTKVLGIDCTIEESIETDFYNDEFISLCHLVASLTEKPEGV